MTLDGRERELVEEALDNLRSIDGSRTRAKDALSVALLSEEERRAIEEKNARDDLRSRA